MTKNKAELTPSEMAEKLYREIQRAFTSTMGLVLSTTADLPLSGEIPKRATGNDLSISVIADCENFRVFPHFHSNKKEIKNYKQKCLCVENAQYQVAVPKRDLLHWDPIELASNIVSEIQQLFKDLETLDLA